MKNQAVKTHTECRMCKSSTLTEFLNLGKQPLANSFLRRTDLKRPEPMYPLRVLFCSTCGLSQLGEVVDPNLLFRDYIYFSSGMPKLSDHFRQYAEEVVCNFAPSKKDLVVEIGSNDGILLSAVKKLGPRVLGIDPALNVVKIANKLGATTMADFFSEKLADKIVKKYGKARAVIGNNVVAHIDDHHDLIRGVKKLLTDDGVFVFEAPYLVDMFENLTFDTIYHEHLSYLSVRPLSRLFGLFGMEIFDVKILPVQGNSLRVYVGNKDAHTVKPIVQELIEREMKLGMHTLGAHQRLAKDIRKLKQEVRKILANLKSRGRKVAAYGAPAKGNTLLNYFGIGPDIIEYATEALPSKVGLYTPGMRIPVHDIDEARRNPPDYYLLLAWNYQDTILEKESDFRNRGGKFILPVGHKRIIEDNTRVSYAQAVYGKQEIAAVVKVLGNPSRIVPGYAVREFEKRIADVFGKKYGVMVNSGSSANELALEVLHLPKGAEVITPILTFATTLAPLVRRGLIPVFVDVEPGTYVVDIRQVERAVTPKTKALMIPSLIGNVPAMDKLRKIAKRHSLYFIEDSCDTLGAKFKNKPSGGYSDITTTSFYASHIITTAGAGGMVCFHDPVLAKEALVLSSWGRESALFGVHEKSEDITKRFRGLVDGEPYDAKFIFSACGYNFQPAELNGAFGLAQLNRLEEFTSIRKRNFAKLKQFFAKYADLFELPRQGAHVDTAWLSFPLTIKKGAPFSRFELTKYLEEHNIQTRPIFTGNVLRQPAFHKILHRKLEKEYPVTDHIMRNGFLIGAHHGMTEKHMKHLQETVVNFLKPYV